MDLLMAVLLWLLVLVSPTSHETVKPLLPDCRFYEDGWTVCETFTLSPYDDVIERR